MDVAFSNVPVNLESVAVTSMVDGNEGEPVAPPAKKQRFGDEMNRVAEIVLVLSALGRMRGGKTPTELELELMVEAKSKLAGMCQEFTPKDIIDRDCIRGVIEDLGLNGKLKDPRLGFRAPKLTISEKLSLGKRKMEEAKKFTSHLSQPNGTATQFVRTSTNLQPLSSGIVTPLVSAAKNVSVSTTGSHFRMLNGASQGTGTASSNYYTASWSQPQSTTISFSNAPDKKVPSQSFRPFMSQTPQVKNQPVQGMHYGQTTSSDHNNHTEIAKIIQKVLQPRDKKYPLWNPPSRDYMSRAIKCQMCEATINELDTLLICDACEKAYHLKCLQAKGVPKSDWHCSRCVKAFAGKPFPPIYSRVIARTAAKMPTRVQSSTAKKVGSMDTKVDQQKPIVITSPGVLQFSGAGKSHSETASVNANTTTSTTKTPNIGSQLENNSPAPVSLTKTPDPKAIASSSAVMNNGLLSKPVSSTSSSLPVNATSNAIWSTPKSDSLVAETPTVTENGDNSSTASATAGHTTEVHALTVTSSRNSQPELSHSENAKAIEGAAMENVARCENPSESISHSDSLNAITKPEASEDGMERSVSETCQNHPIESPAATVISDKESKIIAESSVPQENSADQTEKTASQLPSVSFNDHSQAEEETPNVQDSAPGDSDDRSQEETEFDKSNSIKEVDS